jgi:hypothetical protein
MKLLETILEKCPHFQNHKKIFAGLRVTLISFRGRFNHTNLSRYSDLDEKAIAASLQKKLSLIEFNQIGNKVAIPCNYGQNSGVGLSFCS